jgi:hypothetical protein
MNKKFILLPAAVLLLAACGGTPSSSSSSAPPSSSTPPSSTALDTNIYSVVGAFQGWNPSDEDTVMTRQTGTNKFTFTLDLYVDTQWKLVINQNWDAGQVNPSSPGVTVQENGTAVANFLTAGGTNMEAVGDGYDGYNFNTKVNGSYTIEFTSLPALSRVLNIVRNGDPVVPPPTNIDWYLVGNFTDPQWENGFVAANQFTMVSEGVYEKTLDLLQGYEFKLVRMVGTVPSWNGTGMLGTVTPAEAIGGTDNFIVETNGNYKVTITDTATPRVANFVRLSDPVVAPPEEVVYFLRGVLGTGEDRVDTWGGDLPKYELVESTTTAGLFEVTVDLYVGNQFKVVRNNGLNWYGFSNITTKDASEIGGSDNIDVLAHGNYKVSITDSSKSISIVRLGAPIIEPAAPAAVTPYNIVGDVTSWNNNNPSFKLSYDEVTSTYSFTGLVLPTGLFRIVESGTWGPNIGFSNLTAVPTGFTAHSNDNNISVSEEGVGTYNVTLVFEGTTAQLTLTKVVS